MWKTVSKHADSVFIWSLLVYIVFGLVVLTSASVPVGHARYDDAYYFVRTQILLGIIPGAVLFYIFYKWSYLKWQKLAPLAYLLAIILLVLVFIPGVGKTLNGARSWIDLRWFSYQPAEIAKLALIIFGAKLLSSAKYNLTDWQHGLIPALVMLSPILVLVALQPDIGTLAVLGMILFSLLFAARVPGKYMAILGGLGVGLLVVLVLVAPYRLQRLTIFMHPELDPQGIGYHVNQAHLAIGSGGLWGYGLGLSRQKMQYLPEVSADSVFAILAEELGFVLAAGTVLFIVFLGWRMLRIARQASDDFGRLVVVGVAVWAVGQSFLNIAAMVGLMPLTGVPLPFISHGGSATMALLAGMGMVAGVNRES